MNLPNRILPSFLALLISTSAGAQSLAPFKDKLFAYPPVLETDFNGKYIRVAYHRQRDLYGRDEVPEKKVKPRYVSNRVKWHRSSSTYASQNGKQKYISVTASKPSPWLTVIYLHGQGGNRFQGVNNDIFGGNFNRLQNLMIRNNGLLISPDFTNFKRAGKQDVSELVSSVRQKYPKTKIILACVSMAGRICWHLAKQPNARSLLDGMFLLATQWDEKFLTSKNARKKSPNLPLVIAHGTWDPIFRADLPKKHFGKLIAQNPSYPARFVMFDSGKHGAPLRMVDWRRELNWITSLKL